MPLEENYIVGFMGTRRIETCKTEKETLIHHDTWWTGIWLMPTKLKVLFLVIKCMSLLVLNKPDCFVVHPWVCFYFCLHIFFVHKDVSLTPLQGIVNVFYISPTGCISDWKSTCLLFKPMNHLTIIRTINIYHCQVVLIAWSSLTLYHHLSQSSITSRRSSRLHLVSTQSWCMQVLAGMSMYWNPSVFKKVSFGFL